ncbi:MAG: hypothetical protein D6722_13470 [Bacteroidetes bacterium]|nr:MAG: hypothetical protein D6722_13470 [Bacteroidota bacterium]
MKHLIWVFLGLLLLPQLTQAQDNRYNVFQFSGLVVSQSTEQPIPYVRIRVNHTRSGAMSNTEGFYSVPVGLGDTLYFTHIGYHASKLIVKDYLEQYQGDKSQYIYAINYLLEDTFSLDSVFIFPYDSPEELRTAVVNLDVTNLPLEQNARENLDPATLHAIMATLPVDGNERLLVGRQMYFDQYQTRNLLPTIGFDPITATRLLQEVLRRTQKRKNKDLNYWED